MNPSKIRLSLVSYLNSKPFLYGIEHHPVRACFEIQLDTPAVCAEKLIDGRADIGLVPVAVLPRIPDCEIVSDFCIGAQGDVSSVLLLSDVPVEQIRKVLLDYQSRTSVALTRILATKFWKIQPVWIAGSAGFENSIGGATAGVVIGDRALLLRERFNYAYDLSGNWQELTGLPFVFACWVSNTSINPALIKQLNEAFTTGVSNINLVINEYGSGPVTPETAYDYLSNKISFNFDEKKKEAMRLFLHYLGELEEQNLLNLQG